MKDKRETRVESMVRMYGEVCSKAQASRILNCSFQTVNNMLRDGRLETACGGEKVDVRSIAEYILNPRQADFDARCRKKYPSEVKPPDAV